MVDVCDKLHPEAKLMVDFLEKLGKNRYTGKSLQEIRTNHALSSKNACGNANFEGKSMEIAIPSADGPEASEGQTQDEVQGTITKYKLPCQASI